jgi:hypothetical protein
VETNDVFVHRRDGAVVAAVSVLWLHPDVWRVADEVAGYLKTAMSTSLTLAVGGTTTGR